jgi:Luciferase-like monooxygenase
MAARLLPGVSPTAAACRSSVSLTARPLHFGLILPNYGPALTAQALADAAVAAEEAGFHAAWVTDHLIVPADHARVYGTIAEALVSVGFLAARTERIDVGVSALVVPQRNPLVALKQLTSLSRNAASSGPDRGLASRCVAAGRAARHGRRAA